MPYAECRKCGRLLEHNQKGKHIRCGPPCNGYADSLTKEQYSTKLDESAKSQYENNKEDLENDDIIIDSVINEVEDEFVNEIVENSENEVNQSSESTALTPEVKNDDYFLGSFLIILVNGLFAIKSKPALSKKEKTEIYSSANEMSKKSAILRKLKKSPILELGSAIGNPIMKRFKGGMDYSENED